jgi:addiction module HigA family antidote
MTNLLKSYGLPTHRPPTSPGETLRQFLEDLQLSQAVAARALGMTTNRLNEIAQDKRGLSADTALRFAAYFGTTAQFWMNVQAARDLWHELQRSGQTYGAIRQRRPRAVKAAAHAAASPGCSGANQKLTDFA